MKTQAQSKSQRLFKNLSNICDWGCFCENDIPQCPKYASGNMNVFKDHSFKTYAKFSKKLTFLTPWYGHVRVRVRG